MTIRLDDYPVTYVRWAPDQPRIIHWTAPLTERHDAVGSNCLLCGNALKYGQVCGALVVAGEDAERGDRWRAAPAIIVHDLCLLARTPAEMTGYAAELGEAAR